MENGQSVVTSYTKGFGCQMTFGEFLKAIFRKIGEQGRNRI
jgi:hypothetical protein